MNKEENNNSSKSSLNLSVYKHPPEILAEYEKIAPGFTNRMIEMAEKEGEHRRELEKKALDADITLRQTQLKQIRMGQIFGFLIGIFTVACGTYAAINGAEISGSFIGTGGVIGLVSVFIFGGKSKKSKE